MAWRRKGDKPSPETTMTFGYWRIYASPDLRVLSSLGKFLQNHVDILLKGIL